MAIYQIEEVKDEDKDHYEGRFVVFFQPVEDDCDFEEGFQTAEKAFDWIKKQEGYIHSPLVDVVYKDGKQQTWNVYESQENAQERFERLAQELFQLCEKNNWGDPFQYGPRVKLLSEQRKRLDKLKKGWLGLNILKKCWNDLRNEKL
jgi:hypothetical protein